jgi:hypothetical protein
MVRRRVEDDGQDYREVFTDNPEDPDNDADPGSRRCPPCGRIVEGEECEGPGPYPRKCGLDLRMPPASAPGLEHDADEYPWAQDLDGVWHRRPEGDPWVTTVDGANCLTRCGQAIGSVHVSSYDPREVLTHDETLCGHSACFPDGTGEV